MNKNYLAFFFIVVIASAFLAIGWRFMTSDETQSQLTGPALSGAIPGQDIPDISGYIVDQADLIDAQTEAELTPKLAAFSKSGYGEMAVLTVKSLNGLSIEEFGIRVAEKWKVGKNGRDDGVIIIISSGDRKVRIEVGRGVINITDAVAGRILDEVMVPKLKSGDWSGAVSAGVDALIKLTNK